MIMTSARHPVKQEVFGRIGLGLPHLGQVLAEVDISVPHSLHFAIAILIPF